MRVRLSCKPLTQTPLVLSLSAVMVLTAATGLLPWNANAAELNAIEVVGLVSARIRS